MAALQPLPPEPGFYLCDGEFVWERDADGRAIYHRRGAATGSDETAFYSVVCLTPEVPVTRRITFDPKTGDVVGTLEGTTFAPGAGARIAAQVLPGATPELVDEWYGRWLSNDPVLPATQQYRLDSNGVSALIGKPVTVRVYAAEGFEPQKDPVRVFTDVLVSASIVGSRYDRTHAVELQRLGKLSVNGPGYITLEVVA